MLITFIKTILPAKLTKRLSTSSGGDGASSGYSQECLPIDFGGNVENDNIQNFISQIGARANEVEEKFAYLKSFNFKTDATKPETLDSDDTGTAI
jgi:hypothetical protein